MKHSIINHISHVALTACMSFGLVATESSAGIRLDFETAPETFPPLTTRALFPGVNEEGPGVQQPNWYPVYLWRDPDQCAIGPIPIPFPDNHNLTTNVSPDFLNPFPGFHNVLCQPLVDGFGIFENETSVVQRLLNFKGNVPVYFVHSDDVSLDMTWGDLTTLVEDGCALQGMADLSEILQGESPDPVNFPGGAQVPSFKINLKGSLTSIGYEGISFSVHTVGQNTPSQPSTVRTFKVKGLNDIMRPDTCPQQQ